MTRSSTDREDLLSELMLDAGLPGDAPLKAALESIAGLSALPAPAPRGDLAALLAPSAAPDGGSAPDGGTDPDDELARRRRRKWRPAVVAGAVVTAMGLGIGGVAASGSLSGNSPEFVEGLIAAWAPQWNSAPPSLVPAAPGPDAPTVTFVPTPSIPPAVEPPRTAAQPEAIPPATVPAAASSAAPAGKAADGKKTREQAAHGKAAHDKAGKARAGKKEASGARGEDRPGGRGWKSAKQRPA